MVSCRGGELAASVDDRRAPPSAVMTGSRCAWAHGGGRWAWSDLRRAAVPGRRKQVRGKPGATVPRGCDGVFGSGAGHLPTVRSWRSRTIRSRSSTTRIETPRPMPCALPRSWEWRPRWCSTSRRRRTGPRSSAIVDGLEDPVTDLVRRDSMWKKLGLTDEDAATREQVIELLLKHKQLLQRPVVVKDGTGRSSAGPRIGSARCCRRSRPRAAPEKLHHTPCVGFGVPTSPGVSSVPADLWSSCSSVWRR